MQEGVTMLFHFVTLIFLVGIIENLEQAIERIIGKKLPEWLGFLIIWGIAYFVVWVGDWRFMQFLGYESDISWGIWVEWGLSSLVIAAGSDRLEKKFNLIKGIPNLLGNMKDAVRTREKYDDWEPKI